MKKKIIIIMVILAIIALIALLSFEIISYKNGNEIEVNTLNNNDDKKQTIKIGDVTEIICTNHDDKYNIINQEKISNIKALIENQSLNQSNVQIDGNNDDYIEIRFCNNQEETKLLIDKNNNIEFKDSFYLTNIDLYNEVLNLVNPTYYLHNSELKLPDEKLCKEMQNEALSELNADEITEVSNKLRSSHVTMEYLLINGAKNLKQSNSIYWKLYNNAETITEPTGDDLDFTDDNCFRAVAANIKEIANVIKNEEVKEDFNNIYDRLNIAMKYKDLGEMFKIHEKIHDFDYWIINYPAYFDNAPAPDWEGIETYFGTII